MKLITDPNGFFEELKQREVRIRKPLVIVSALAVLVFSSSRKFGSIVAQRVLSECINIQKGI